MEHVAVVETTAGVVGQRAGRLHGVTVVLRRLVGLVKVVKNREIMVPIWPNCWGRRCWGRRGGISKKSEQKGADPLPARMVTENQLSYRRR